MNSFIKILIKFSDDSFLISAIDQVTCNDVTHYCGFTLGGYGDSDDNVFIQVTSEFSIEFYI